VIQLPLPMAWSGRDEKGHLLIHAGNADAVALLRSWPRWPSPCTLLVGPRRSGRSLLGRLFEAETGGMTVDEAERCDEARLFNLWNEARDGGWPLLLIADDALVPWRIALPDLRTRIGTAALARIVVPDEAAAAALIAHGLETAGSAFAPDLPDFLARRTARCYETIDSVVTRLNAASLASGQKLSIVSAKAILDLAEPGATADTTSDEDMQHRG